MILKLSKKVYFLQFYVDLNKKSKFVKAICVHTSESSHYTLSENGVLRNFAKFTGKHLCQSLFFNKVTAQVFSCEFCEISENTFFKEHLWVAVSLMENSDWINDVALEQDLRDCMRRNLKKKEILNFMKRDYEQYCWITTT